MSAARQMRPARILEITSYPPPRAGWGVRVEFLKQHLEASGHECVVLNIGKSRNIPSSEYETVLGAGDYVRKVWRFCRAGFTTHVHINGSTPKGLVLTIAAQILNLLFGRRCVLTFHAGVKQVYFPRSQAPMLCPVFWLMFTMARTIICNNGRSKRRSRSTGYRPGRSIPFPRSAGSISTRRPSRSTIASKRSTSATTPLCSPTCASARGSIWRR